MSDVHKIEKIANDLISRELAPRLKDVHGCQKSSPVGPQQIAVAAAALKTGAWTEKQVRKHLDKAFGG